MPLKRANVPSEWQKKRSIGIMRSMALSSAGGGAMLRAAIELPQRQKLEQNFDDRAGIAADVAAVGQNLLSQFLSQSRRWRI